MFQNLSTPHIMSRNDCTITRLTSISWGRLQLADVGDGAVRTAYVTVPDSVGVIASSAAQLAHVSAQDRADDSTGFVPQSTPQKQ